MGQFRSAGGLVLLGGRSWGLRFPAAHLWTVYIPVGLFVTVVTKMRFLSGSGAFLSLAPYRRWGGCLLSADLRLRSGRPLRQTSPRTLFCVVEPRLIGGALFLVGSRGRWAGRRAWRADSRKARRECERASLRAP